MTATETVLIPVAPDRYRFGADGAVTILGSRGDADGVLFWPPRVLAPTTGGPVTEVELAVTGTVWTWTYVHAPWPGEVSPSGGAGYAAGLVDLDGPDPDGPHLDGSDPDQPGPRLAAVLVGGPDDWAVGTRVRAVALPVSHTPDGTRCVLAFEKEDA